MHEQLYRSLEACEDETAIPRLSCPYSLPASLITDQTRVPERIVKDRNGSIMSPNTTQEGRCSGCLHSLVDGIESGCFQYKNAPCMTMFIAALFIIARI